MKFFKSNREVFFIFLLITVIVFSLKQEVMWVESKHVRKVKIEKAIWNYLESKEDLVSCKKSLKDISKCKKEIKEVIRHMKIMDKSIFKKS
jgi:hypothetical protein